MRVGSLITSFIVFIFFFFGGGGCSFKVCTYSTEITKTRTTIFFENAGLCSEDWNQMAKETLTSAIKMKPNTGVAKNVILFIGDGLGVSTLNAARIYRGQKNNKTGEETVLEWEKFPYAAFSKVRLLKEQILPSYIMKLFHFSFNSCP